MQILEDEAISLALGIAIPTRTATRSGVVRTYTGTINVYDHYLSTEVPQANLRIRFQLGSNIWDTYTQSNGYFSITGAIPNNASYIHMFQHPRWKITTKSSTAPYSVNWFTADYWWTSSSTVHKMCPAGSPPAYAILPAVNFYYNGSHSIRTWHYNDGIRVIAMNEDSPTALASFVWSRNNVAYIKVYNNHIDYSNTLIGAILHEFGHFTHYGERGGYTGSAYNGFNAVHQFIKESYAEYAGWHMGMRYYTLKGHTPAASFDLTGCFAQRWRQTQTGSSSWYSPLFVDLVDNYDQRTALSGLYNSDPISGVPHSAIKTMASECTTWASVKTKLQSFVGVYYTQAELNTFVAPYDYWFTNN